MSLKYKIVKAIPEDVDEVITYIKKMLVDMKNFGGNEINDSEETWKKLRKEFIEALDNPNRYYIFAKIDENIAGFAECKVSHDAIVFQHKKLLHISSLYTLPDYRGKGVASGLFDDMVKWGKSKGCVQVELNVLKFNTARHLYEKLGFEDFEINMRKDI